MATFKKYFPTPDLANQYARQPEKIANHVYASRNGNGDEASGDGWRYRGRGGLQLTGKTNYTAFFKSIGLDIATANADLVATNYSMLSAAWYWNSRNLSATADAGVDENTITKITKVINGGTNGLPDRITKTGKYSKLLTT